MFKFYTFVHLNKVLAQISRPRSSCALLRLKNRCGERFVLKTGAGGVVFFPGRATRPLQEGQVGELVHEVLQGGRPEGLVRRCLSNLSAITDLRTQDL